MEQTPESILIVGSGLFGLSTAWSLASRPRFAKTSITVVDDAHGSFPPDDSASVDASRIVRADYADAHYSALGAEAQRKWRRQGDDEFGGQGRYFQNGFLLMGSTGPGAPAQGKKSGIEYVRMSRDNVSRIAEAQQASGSDDEPDRIETFETRAALQEYIGTAGNPGDWGYVNRLSGWSDNSKAMRWMFGKVRDTGRVSFVDAKVTELVTAPGTDGRKKRRVTGARLADGRVLSADAVMVAAGAWTGSLVDLRGRCEATGQVMAYVRITPEEEARLGDRPTIMNLSNGQFIIPPRDGLLKVARHGFGYLNPRVVRRALPPAPLGDANSDERPDIVASVPRTSRDPDGDLGAAVPYEANGVLRQALVDLLPRDMDLHRRPWHKARLCWYSDTRDADWLVDWHPGYQGLFVATGDSGHGFKFLPVIGDRLADVLEGKGGALADKWRWKDVEDDGCGKVGPDGVFRGIATDDGSRGGRVNMILDEELRRTGDSLAAKL